MQGQGKLARSVRPALIESTSRINTTRLSRHPAPQGPARILIAQKLCFADIELVWSTPERPSSTRPQDLPTYCPLMGQEHCTCARCNSLSVAYSSQGSLVVALRLLLLARQRRRALGMARQAEYTRRANSPSPCNDLAVPTPKSVRMIKPRLRAAA